MERVSLQREMLTVKIEENPVPVKVARLNSQIVNVHAEYEDCRRIAKHSSSSLQSIMRKAEQMALEALNVEQ